MSKIPRLAIGAFGEGVMGTVEPAATRYITWALADLLSRSSHLPTRRQVQLFRGDDRPAGDRAARAAAGLQSRQLDSWTMSAGTCRELFLLGCHGKEIALVEGTYGARSEVPSDLNQLADWLQMPRLVVLDSRCLSDCRLPRRPRAVDAVLLDHVPSRSAFCALATTLEAVWGVPVVGGLEANPRVREVLDHATPGSTPWREALRAVAAQLAMWTDLERLERLAASAVPFDEPLAVAKENLPKLRLAVAWDDAFNGPTPDFIEMLESKGAEVRDFSPLRDEALPGECDLVYLGCGRVDEHAAELAANTCMLLALRQHAWHGRRVLADGDGLAYACSSLIDAKHRHHTLTGLLSATARRQGPHRVAPVQTQLAGDCWLAPAGTWLRGYRCCHWTLDHEPASRAGLDATREILVSRRTIATQLRVHYAARPDLMRAIFAPRPGTMIAAAAV
ncbi:MAG: hypothetical protein K1X74_08375 [Pirellulales bacterium]|nr:hypothetical protein [Pirellulales bacterium]